MMSALRRPSGLLIDLSGTIHIENQEIKGSINAVKLLRRKNIPFLFVTNTSKESQKALKNRLDHIGFDIKSEEIFSSLTAAYNLIKSRELKPMLLISESALEVCICIQYILLNVNNVQFLETIGYGKQRGLTHPISPYIYPSIY